MYKLYVFTIWLLLFCAQGFGFSNHKLDSALVKNAPAIAHFSEYANKIDRFTAGALLRADHLHFSAAPDPSAFMKKMHAENAKKRPKDPTEISVLSFNVALLQAEIFGLITVVKSPHIPERLSKLPDLIFQRNYDVVMLQELWSAKLAPFIAKAKEYGYKLYFGSDRGYEDGLAIFVKQALLKDAKYERLRWHPFEHQDPIENFPGVGVQRGFLHLQFETPKLGKVHIYNTHLQSFRKYWKKRNFQARELGIAVEEQTAPEDVVIVGGDINASPYFKDDTWVNAEGDLTKSWWRNAIAYSLLLYYGGLDDAMVMGLPADLADIDVVAAKKFHSYQEACSEKHLSFTATDCNSLNHKQYVQHEPPSRQDHIMMRDDLGRAKVTDRGIVFTEKVDFGSGLVIEPSDHYGVYVKIAVAKPNF